MVTETKISQESIVLQNVRLQLLNSRFVLELKIGLQEPLVEFHDLSKSQMLTWCYI